jgi:hypothetical protein
MAMDLGASAGGGIALQDVLRQLAEVAFRKQQLAQESQRIGIAQQAQTDNTAYRNASLKSLEDERATSAQLRKQASGKQFAETLPMGTKLDQGGLERLTDADMAGPEFVEHKDATLGSTNLSGAVQGGAAAPKILRLMSSANPGQGPSDTFRGTAGQQFSAQSRQDALSAREQARHDREAQLAQAAQDRKDAAAAAQTGREDLARLTASLHGGNADLQRELLQGKIDAAQEKTTDKQRTADTARNAAVASIDDTSSALDELIDEKGNLKSGVGGTFGIDSLRGYIPGTSAADAKARLDRLQSRLTVDLLGEMKRQSRTGASGFGALSEKELMVLQNAAARLSSSQSDESARQALLDVRKQLAGMRQRAGGATPASTVTPDVKPDYRKKYDY